MDSVTLLEITSVVIMEGLSMCFFRFTGNAWASLTQGGGSWEARVKGDLSIRPDTNSINSSPVTGMLPIVRVQHGCPSAIHIPGTLVILLVKDGRLQGASHPPPPHLIQLLYGLYTLSALGEFMLPKYVPSHACSVMYVPNCSLCALSSTNYHFFVCCLPC